MNFFHFVGIRSKFWENIFAKNLTTQNVLERVLLHTQRNAKFSNKLSTAHDISHVCLL